MVATKDSQYTYNKMGGQQEGEVSALLRPHLAREYAALDASGKARFREHIKLAAQLGGGSDMDAFVTLFGDKAGSETIAGQKCDVYRMNKTSACVVPGAPMVMLRWVDPSQGTTLVAKKVSLNGPLPGQCPGRRRVAGDGCGAGPGDWRSGVRLDGSVGRERLRGGQLRTIPIGAGH